MVRGRKIAFDYGDARIGVAICDPDGILASPLPFLDAKHPKLLKQIEAILDEYQPITIFLGLPKSLSGEDGEAVLKVKSFSERLTSISQLPQIFIDERLSTIAAQKRLHEAGKNSKESRLLIDSMSAVTILETGLAHEAQS
jgi:putative Holliday junction resolvase